MPAELVRISSATDPAIDPYTRIRERDLVGRDGLFVAEGEVVLRVLVDRGRFRVRSLLLEERRVEAVRDVVDRLPDGVPVFVVPQAVMDTVVGFSIHRGILALGDRGDEHDVPSLLEASRLVVGLIGLTNHDNVGGIFRNAAAFGASSVLLDDATCDPLYRKAIRVSAGAALVVPFARLPSPEAMLDQLERAGFEAIALSPRAPETLESIDRTKKRALLLGAEGPGLPESVLARARRVRIDMAPGLDSLNVAVTSGIALYESTRGGGSIA